LTFIHDLLYQFHLGDLFDSPLIYTPFHQI
jgi:hypothetical protein